MKGEHLSDEQMLKIVKRAEEKYGYNDGEHQRVIVEHIKNGRQHFHVIWNRVSVLTGRPVWPGHHWNKSKEVCREMEKELGLKKPVPRWLWIIKRALTSRGGGRGGGGAMSKSSPLPAPKPSIKHGTLPQQEKEKDKIPFFVPLRHAFDPSRASMIECPLRLRQDRGREKLGFAMVRQAVP
jgi:hypothetical protein